MNYVWPSERFEEVQSVSPIVALDPMVFLDMTTTSDEDLARIVAESATFSFYQRKSWPVPFLELYPSGAHAGHDGRHRAAALHKADPRALFQIELSVLPSRRTSWEDVPREWLTKGRVYSVRRLLDARRLLVLSQGYAREDRLFQPLAR